MPVQATFDDANLILRLYEMRREETLRKARSWFISSFRATTLEEIQKIAPPGSPENGYMRQVTSYWEMACSFVTAGILNQELLFESSGELLLVWELIRDVVPAIRGMMQNPHAFANLETVCTAYAKWMESQGPNAYTGFQNMVKGLSAPKAEVAQA